MHGNGLLVLADMFARSRFPLLEVWWTIPPFFTFDSPFRSDRQWLAFQTLRIMQLERSVVGRV